MSEIKVADKVRMIKDPPFVKASVIGRRGTVEKYSHDDMVVVSLPEFEGLPPYLHLWCKLDEVKIIKDITGRIETLGHVIENDFSNGGGRTLVIASRKPHQALVDLRAVTLADCDYVTSPRVVGPGIFQIRLFTDDKRIIDVHCRTEVDDD